MITTVAAVLLLVEAIAWLIWLLHSRGFVASTLRWRLIRGIGVLITAGVCAWLALELTGFEDIGYAALGSYLGLHIAWIIERIVTWSRYENG